MSSLFTLFYLYDPWLFHFFRMAFFAGAVGIVILAYQLWQKKLPQGITLPIDSLVVIATFIGLSAIPMLLQGTKDISVVIMYCKSFLLFMVGIVLYTLFYQQQKARFIHDLKIGISIQALIGFLGLIGVPFIIELALSTNIVLPRFYGSEQEYRLYNITSSAFFQLSLFYLMLLHFLLAYNEKHNSIHPIFLLLMLFIGLISGRSFLVLSILSIGLYFKWRYLPALILFGFLCLFFAFNYADNKYVAHALEPLINIINAKGYVSASTDTLIEKHLFIPELKQILYGDGYYYSPKGGYYGGTDSGFLRQALCGGIAYVLLCFLFTAYFVRKIAYVWFNGSWKFILSTLAILTILNVKADTYAFPGLMMIFLMFLSLFGQTGKTITLFNLQKK